MRLKMRYEKSSAIQQKAIPAVLIGYDLMVTAKTGPGQTAAFVLPILMTVNYAQDKDNSFPGFYQP